MSKPEPDIYIGPGDTAPIIDYVLRGPRTPAGDEGAPLDLTGATVTFKCQLKNQSAAAETRDVALGADPAAGETVLDLLATGGAIPSGDYDARYVAVLASGHTISVPNGGPERDDEFLWLQVAPDFATVG